MLEIQALSKRYGALAAVDDVSLSIREGEFFSLLGPSGCGKTSLLRLLAGFERPDSGSLKLDGQEIGHEPPHKRAFNMVFQRYALFPHLDVARNVAFGLEAKGGVAGVEIRKRVDEALALVAMKGFETRNVTTLSGGQQQRVAIARAIVNRPRMLLLDEPLAALDLKLRQRMQVELRAWQRRLGMTFVFVTHAQDEALALSDRIAVLNGGKVEQVGTPVEVYREPASPFVATFIGTVNKINGAFVRPEDLTLVHAGSKGAAQGALRGTLRDLIFRGASYEAVVDLAGSTEPLLVHVPANHALRTGEDVLVQVRT